MIKPLYDCTFGNENLEYAESSLSWQESFEKNSDFWGNVDLLIIAVSH